MSLRQSLSQLGVQQAGRRRMQVQLRDLDLSFNAIQSIQAAQLKPLTLLSSLSLYSNHLQTLADLPPLPALSYLSVGVLVPQSALSMSF